MFIYEVANFAYSLLQAPSPDPALSDPLVNKGAQHLIYIAAGVFTVLVVAIVGFLSRKVEHAIATALIMSLRGCLKS
jgi:hypothetical protein